MQKRADALLPATINRIETARDVASDAVLVASYSNTEPGVWHIHHRSTGKPTRLGTGRPRINSLAMSGKSMVRYKAVDGLKFPAYLTLPKRGNGKNVAWSCWCTVSLGKRPDLYRCGVGWVGVTDINLLYNLSFHQYLAG